MLGRPQPSFLTMLAGGYSPVYSCHVPGRDMRSKPIGTGPFKVVDFKRNESIKLVKNPDYWKKGRPYLDAIDWKIVPNRSTRMLGFQSRRVRHDVRFRRHLPAAQGRQGAKPDAVCEARPTNVSSNLLVNRDKQPFDNPDIRKRDGAGARQQGVRRHPEPGQRSRRRGRCCRRRPASGACPRRCCRPCSATRPTARRAGRGAQDHEEGWATAPTSRSRSRSSTRNIAIYRDPAVILIDQLKQIYIEGELEPIDTTVWYTKIQRERLPGRHEPDRRRHRRSRRQLLRELLLDVGPQLQPLQESRGRQADRRSSRPNPTARSARRWSGRSRRSWPTTWRGRSWATTSPTPAGTRKLKGIVLQVNSIYNGWRFEDVWLDR